MILRAALALAFALLLVVPAAAETVFLKNGGKHTGKIIEETDTFVRIEITLDGGGTAVLKIDRARIARIEQASSFDDFLALAQAKLDKAQWDAAENAFRELVEERPKHAQARVGLATALVGQKRLAEAVRTLENYTILVKNGRDARLMLYLGECYMLNGQYKEAREAAREAHALEPMDAGIREASLALQKRIERVRDGTEAAEKAEAERRKQLEEIARQRQSFDKDEGTHYDAALIGRELKKWTDETNPGLFEAVRIRLYCHERETLAYERGGDEIAFQRSVDNVTATVRINESMWTALFDDKKKLLMYGWFYQLRQRYPNTQPTVNAIQREVDNRGREKLTDLARASWDGKRAEIVADLFTKPNVDPGRAARLARHKK